MIVVDVKKFNIINLKEFLLLHFMDYYSNFSGKERLTKCPFMADTTKFYSYPEPQFCERAGQNSYFLYKLDNL